MALLKDVDYDIEFIGGIKNPFLVEKVYSTPPFRPLELFTYNLTFSRLATELLLQHLKQEEVAVVKEAYSGLGNLLDGDNRY
jgi:hypothetical protein